MPRPRFVTKVGPLTWDRLETEEVWEGQSRGDQKDCLCPTGPLASVFREEEAERDVEV